MIGEALDAGVVSVASVAALVLFAGGLAAAWATLRTQLGGVLDAIKAIGRRMDRHEEAAADHRHEDAARFQEHELRVARLEHALERDGVLTPVRDTGPHDRVPRELRRRARDTGDTGPGETR